MRQSIPERTRTVISICSIIMDVCIQYARAYGVCSCFFALQSDLHCLVPIPNTTLVMFSIGDIAWWAKAKPQPWPVQITGQWKDEFGNTHYHCKMFSVDGNINNIERDIHERHLSRFLENLEKYRTGANAATVDKISEHEKTASRKRRREEEVDVEELRKEVRTHIQTLHTTMNEVRALMSEMRDLQVSFKASCEQYVKESLEVYKSTVKDIIDN